MVANRGEIAIRIFKTAKAKGWATVAVYSEADKDSLHVQYADESFCIGPAPAIKSYLNIESIIHAAIALKVDCIHPGYGFLSENASFAQAVRDAHIHFAGPDAESMKLLGNKISAKKMAAAIGMPLVPGHHQAIADLDEALKLASEIGYPVMIKAAAGGGGKGMRIIAEAAQLREGILLAQAEAKASFGYDDIFIERFIPSPRHIEIQVIGDSHGHLIYLPERECSLQRRHQKIMEESPANDLSDEIRLKMSEDAVRLAISCGYFSTGTVEFIVDRSGSYYFLEMNTRLQVEHTVTEMITGLDLVDLQLDIAMGNSLKINQKDVLTKGHAIQWRICAEDPSQKFAPSSGKITRYHVPRIDQIRLDSGYAQNKIVSIFYDPMIAKLIAWDTDRIRCLNRLISALQEFDIEGITTTIAFGIQVLNHSSIQKGHYGVDFIDKNLESILEDSSSIAQAKAAAALALYLYQKSLGTLPNN